MTFCNRCGKAFDHLDDQEKFGFDYYVGYGSKHDCEHIRANFCCNCFDELIEQLKPQLKIPLEIEEYDPFTNAPQAYIHIGGDNDQE